MREQEPQVTKNIEQEPTKEPEGEATIEEKEEVVDTSSPP